MKMAFYRLLRIFQFPFDKINLLFILTLYASLSEQLDTSRSRSYRKAQVRQVQDDKDFIRQVPLCVDDMNLHPEEEGLVRWTWIFDFYKYNTYIPVSNGKTSPSGMITKFELKAIQVDDTDSGYKGVLKNWIHIHLESAVILEGLYVQAIGAPWGIPFGEFMTDFDCEDCNVKTSKYQNDIFIVPCTHRAALSYEHPTVFTYGGRGFDNRSGHASNRPVQFFKSLHFNFRYTQYPGVDFTYAQFLVIAVRNFNGNFSRFETFFTPTYKVDVQDNVGGAFYPFYYGWRTENIKCHSTDLSKDWETFPGANATVKIRYNRAFDFCLRHKLNEEWSTCPPGPIQMASTDVPLSLQEWIDLRHRYSMRNTSDGNYNGDYGPDGQFCNDSGTWEWTDGQANWTIPDELELIIEEDGLFLNDTSTADTTFSIVCVSTSAIENCLDYVDKERETKQCLDDLDYHRSTCIDPPAPMFGKWNGSGDFYLLKKGWNELTFTEQVQAQAIAWGRNEIFGVHGKLMIFAWTVGWNIMFFSARFLKEYSMIERKSSYFGIGGWLWQHIIWTYVTIAAMLSGLYLIGNQNAGTWIDNTTNLHDLCNLHSDRKDTVRCLHSTAHRYLGATAAILFILAYLSGWVRPTSSILRLLTVGYHCGMGYLGKMFYYLVMLLAFVDEFISFGTYMTVIIIDFASSIMFVVATAGNCAMERKFPHRDSDPTVVAPPIRRYFPVPEAISTFDMPNKLRKLLNFTVLPIYIVVQILCFVLIAFSY